MVELLGYLAANGFTNYIASGGGRDFMRPISQEVYGMPRDRVIGSSNSPSIKTSFRSAYSSATTTASASSTTLSGRAGAGAGRPERVDDRQHEERLGHRLLSMGHPQSAAANLPGERGPLEYPRGLTNRARRR